MWFQSSWVQVPSSTPFFLYFVTSSFRLMLLPTLEEINQSASLIGQHMQPTPQYKWPLLCQRCETDVWVKHENMSPIGSFKVRGGINYMSQIPENHVITATRGNHGQSVAFAAQIFGKNATVIVPYNNSQSKNAAMRALGANLSEYGRDFSEAHDYAHQQAAELGLHFVPSFDRKLVAGVASMGMELFDAVPNLDAVYVPIGLGSEICAVIAAREALGLEMEIIGVVAANAPSYFLSFNQGRAVETDSANTFADGVAVRIPNTQALDIILRHVSKVVKVSESEIESAIHHYFDDTHQLIEGAGAATLAALLQEKSRMKDKQVAVIASGGNIDKDLFRQVLQKNV